MMRIFVGAMLSAAVLAPVTSSAYETVSRWHGTSGEWGRGAVVTWSIVPDGTLIPPTFPFGGERLSPSMLVEFFDGLLPNAVNVDAGVALAARPWFPLVDSSLQRWAQLSGLELRYEPLDDGALVSGAAPGAPGVRGDIRLGGHAVDHSLGVLAYAFFPNRGDLVVDVEDGAFLGDPAGGYLRLRNTLMHELGHSLGLDHVQSDADLQTPGAQPGSFLMEPAFSPEFDGPQLDDLLGIQQLYGDPLEKGLGNDEPATATSLGLAEPRTPLRIGQAVEDRRLSAQGGEFLSISHLADVDLFAVEIARAGVVNVVLEPTGAAYPLLDERGVLTTFDARSLANLGLNILAADGVTPLAVADGAGIGEGESLQLRLSAPGRYFLRVTGREVGGPQLYTLAATLAVPEPSRLAAFGLAMAVAARIARRRRRSLRARFGLPEFLTAECAEIAEDSSYVEELRRVARPLPA